MRSPRCRTMIVRRPSNLDPHMVHRLISFGHTAATIVASLRCPNCRQQGTFEAIPNILDLQSGSVPTLLGQRRCPNDQCRAHVFVILEKSKIVTSYPAERLDFDASSVPTPVATALEEAITCSSTGCFTAAAIMVRKTLEELCHDRGASGPNLKERIKALGSRVVLPTDLIDGMDHLRLLGNDAAHIESQNFTKVGKDEVEVGILFAKEVLKAVYQYGLLVDKLRALQSRSSSP